MTSIMSSLTQIGIVHNPTVPYTGDIPGGLGAGKQIFLQGILPMSQEVFAINLQCGKQQFPKVEVALHLSIRFNQSCMVRNSHQGGSWKNEEKFGPGFPFHPGQPFEMIIAVEPSQYKIAVNGVHFTEFQHRIPIHLVDTISIGGGVSVMCIRYDGPAPSFDSTCSLSVPYFSDIPGGLSAGKTIFIQGSLPMSQEAFGINLQCGRQQYPHLDVALHFNPRFNEGCVVRNSHQGGGWKNEERYGAFPFHPGQNFDVTIVVETGQYKISVNGQHFTEFQHRIPVHRVNTLHIGGGLTLSCVHVTDSNVGQPMPQIPPNPYGKPAQAYGQPMPQIPPNPYGKPPQAYASGAMAMSYPASGPPGHPIIYNPPVPFTSGIPGGITPGKMIYIVGNIGPMPSRFNVNFQEGAMDSSDVAFHMDVRFRYGNDINQVVRSHKSRGTWGQEEKHVSHFPFSVNASFDMIILVEPSSFKVAVNNNHFLEFNHRLHPPIRYSTLMITGDVHLTQVRFQ